MRFVLIPEEVAALAAGTLRHQDPENAEAQALSDWLDINQNPRLANVLMDEKDAHAFWAHTIIDRSGISR